MKIHSLNPPNIQQPRWFQQFRDRNILVLSNRRFGVERVATRIFFFADQLTAVPFIPRFQLAPVAPDFSRGIPLLGKESG